MSCLCPRSMLIWRRGYLRRLVIFIVILKLMIVSVSYMQQNINEKSFQSTCIAQLENEQFGHRYFSSSQLDSMAPIVFTLVLCTAKVRRSDVLNVFDRQRVQFCVLVKSAAALTNTHITFIVVTDTSALYDILIKCTDDWPDKYRERISFNYRKVWYPPGRQSHRPIFRECASERLFIPDMFPELDATIYLDSDVIFHRPPEELWEAFQYFDENQLSAMPPYLSKIHKGESKSRFAEVGETGIDASVIHMNVTRMNNYPGGWTSEVLKMYDMQKIPDMTIQEIYNVFFHYNPRLFYELPCNWNYQLWMCHEGNTCPMAARKGAVIVHGTDGAFYRDRDEAFKVVFESWHEHQLGSSIGELFETICERLSGVHKKKSNCIKDKNIYKILLGGLKTLT